MFQMTYAPWPTSPYHDNFYDMYISGRPYEPYFTSLRTRTLRNASKEDLLNDKELVSQNFLGLLMYSGKQLMMNYQAIPQVSLIAFLSQIGGALNLWAGITIVVFIELLELGFRTIADWRKSKTVKKTSSMEMKHPDEVQPMTGDTEEEFDDT